MFVRVTHLDIAAGGWNEAVQRFQTTIISALEKTPGFMRLILTGDAKAGKATAISMWQSAPQEEAPGADRADPIVGHMTGLLVGDPKTSGYPELFDREF